MAFFVPKIFYFLLWKRTKKKNNNKAAFRTFESSSHSKYFWETLLIVLILRYIVIFFRKLKFQKYWTKNVNKITLFKYVLKRKALLWNWNEMWLWFIFNKPSIVQELVVAILFDLVHDQKSMESAFLKLVNRCEVHKWESFWQSVISLGSLKVLQNV